MVAPFIYEPKINNMPISSKASAWKDPTVALSLAAAVSLPADMATFRAKPNLATVTLAAQSAFLVSVYPWNVMIFWFAFDVSWNVSILCVADNW